MGETKTKLLVLRSEERDDVAERFYEPATYGCDGLFRELLRIHETSQPPRKVLFLSQKKHFHVVIGNIKLIIMKSVVISFLS